MVRVNDVLDDLACEHRVEGVGREGRVICATDDAIDALPAQRCNRFGIAIACGELETPRAGHVDEREAGSDVADTTGHPTEQTSRLLHPRRMETCSPRVRLVVGRLLMPRPAVMTLEDSRIGAHDVIEQSVHVEPESRRRNEVTWDVALQPRAAGNAAEIRVQEVDTQLSRSGGAKPPGPCRKPIAQSDTHVSGGDRYGEPSPGAAEDLWLEADRRGPSDAAGGQSPLNPRNNFVEHFVESRRRFESQDALCLVHRRHALLHVVLER